MFSLRNIWYWVLERVFSGRFTALKQSLPELVFHSEGGKYWQVFEPVIKAWLSRKYPCAYITPDSGDPAFNLAKENSLFTVLCPGKEMITISFLNNIKTKALVSTTPNLDVYMWRRSKNVSRYIHLFHSPTSVEFYEKYALSFYDDILTVGEFQEEEIRQLDISRNLPEKNFYPTGLTYFDYMLEKLGGLKRETSRFTVLYAPSWGARSSLSLYGAKIIEILVQENIPLIFRPHPQSFISGKEIIEDIRRKYTNNALFSFDSNRTGIISMNNSDILITDLSGILFDYAFLFSRPVILAASEVFSGGYEAEDITGPLWDKESAKALAFDLSGNPNRLPGLIREIKTGLKKTGNTINAFRDKNICNFGTAGKAAADHIESILRKI
jgi:hypothetical protein